MQHPIDIVNVLDTIDYSDPMIITTVEFTETIVIAVDMLVSCFHTDTGCFEQAMVTVSPQHIHDPVTSFLANPALHSMQGPNTSQINVSIRSFLVEQISQLRTVAVNSRNRSSISQNIQRRLLKRVATI